jgi:hypothetical protein
VDALADALVRAMAHLDSAGVRHDEKSAEYETYLEATAAILTVLRRATEAEKDALAAAAERAAAAESSPAFRAYYGGWMEGVFAGRWEGNRRTG